MLKDELLAAAKSVGVKGEMMRVLKQFNGSPHVPDAIKRLKRWSMDLDPQVVAVLREHLREPTFVEWGVEMVTFFGLVGLLLRDGSSDSVAKVRALQAGLEASENSSAASATDVIDRLVRALTSAKDLGALA